MLAYYLRLALRSLRKNVALTILMIVAVAFGIGACMTTLTVFRAMSGDPIPNKSRHLFAVQIDTRGPADPYTLTSDNLDDQLSYLDATNLMQARGSWRQTALFFTRMPLHPENSKLKPFQAHVRAAYADFFPMFDVPFKYGRPWSGADDAQHAPLVVISKKLNERLFGGANSVGRELNLGGEAYRIIGVLEDFSPLPRFYDLDVSPFRMREEAYVPFAHVVDRHFLASGHVSCQNEPEAGFEGFLRSNCNWIKFWVELPNADEVRAYRNHLNNYAAEQQHLGRFNWPPHTKLRNVREWLTYRHVVPSEVSVLMLVSAGFLLVCLLNAAGLMLAKTMRGAADLGVRRALGASRRAVWLQCVMEAGVVGFIGGLIGLALTIVGLMAARAFLSEDFQLMTRMDWWDGAGTVLLAVLATVAAGLYPTWRATRIVPAWYLKTQV